jgi:hypothetical protein
VTDLSTSTADHGSLDLDRIYAPFPTFPAVETAAEGDHAFDDYGRDLDSEDCGPGGEENRRHSRCSVWRRAVG